MIERRVHGNTLENLREDIKHREDVQRTALSLTEYIEKEGNEEWADKLLETVGPWLMVQLADMANFFESTRKFVFPSTVSISGSTLNILVAFTSGGNRPGRRLCSGYLVWVSLLLRCPLLGCSSSP